MLENLARYFRYGSVSSDEDDLEMGLLAPTIDEDIPTSGPSPLKAVPHEIWAKIFQNVDVFADRLALPRVCKTWRDVCRTPIDFKNLYGPQAESFVRMRLGESLGQACAQPEEPEHHHADTQSCIAQYVQKLQAQRWPLVDLVDQAQDWDVAKDERAKFEAIYRQRTAKHFDATRARPINCLRFYHELGALLTVPLGVAWMIVLTQVPAVRRSIGQSFVLVIGSTIIVGPLAASCISGAAVGAFFAVDKTAQCISAIIDTKTFGRRTTPVGPLTFRRARPLDRHQFGAPS